MDISLPPFLFYGLSPLPIPSNVKYLSCGGGGEANFQRERGGRQWATEWGFSFGYLGICCG